MYDPFDVISDIAPVSSSFLEIFLKDVTPKFIFTTIKDMFLGEEEEVSLCGHLDEIK